MRNKYQHYIIEGPDNVGKGSLIETIMDKQGFHLYIHYERPRATDYYNHDLYLWQKNSFEEGFELLNQDIKTIYDRFHLGESIYSPLYRNYNGDYVFQLELDCTTKRGLDDTLLVVLMTSDFGILQDDGLSFDFSKVEQEQDLFINTFHKSIFPNKVLIDVCNGNGEFKTHEEIYNEMI